MKIDADKLTIEIRSRIEKAQEMLDQYGPDEYLHGRLFELTYLFAFIVGEEAEEANQ